MKLPSVSGRNAIDAFASIGYRFDRQSGSHVILRHEHSPHRRLTIPLHPQLAKGALAASSAEAGLTVDHLADLL